MKFESRTCIKNILLTSLLDLLPVPVCCYLESQAAGNMSRQIQSTKYRKIIDRLPVHYRFDTDNGSLSIFVHDQFQVCQVTSPHHLWNMRGTGAHEGEHDVFIRQQRVDETGKML